VGTVGVARIVGTLAAPVLLGLLSLTTGLDVTGWVVGLAAGWGATHLLALARLRSDRPEILPPDWITMSRALLAAAVAALVADAADRPLPVPVVVVLASVALVLDAVDGQVARRTGTATPVGARLDGEVDAFLILVLSVAVARDYGGWVLAIGAARYAFLVAGWIAPWLAAPLPYRYWRKVVAAVQGIALTVAIAGFLPRAVGMAAIAIALLLLAESFGRDVVLLYRTGAGPRTRTVVRRGTALVAAALVWAALVAPDRLDLLRPAAFARVPLEGVVLVGVGLLLPTRPRRVLAAVAGLALGLLTIVKVLDLGFRDQIGRPFDPVLDRGSFGPAIGVVSDSVGAVTAWVLVVLVVLVLVVLVGLVTVSTLLVSSATARHRRRSAGGVAVVGTVWAVCAALSVQLVPGEPVASVSSAGLAADHVRAAQASARNRAEFDAALHAADPYAQLPAGDLLSALRGKDVVIAFVESYGQVAVQGSSFSAGVRDVLRAGTGDLAEAGYSARSAWLDSPTFGGISWLAHSTFQSGLWVPDQGRYDQLVESDRFTLSRAFGRAGWRTVGDIPSNDRDWPEGRSFYRYDRVYDRRDVGYQGPAFSYASMPDQYTLAAFQKLELAAGHDPVMAEIDLVSSHTPWTPLPRMVPWDQVGDGSVFDPMPAQGLAPDVAWAHGDTVRRLYGESIQYSLQALVSWVAQLHDENLVLVLLGDHQPSAKISGVDANHRVPVSFVASDPDVLDRIAPWRWSDGLLPASTAPVWRMDAFRDRFLDAFSAPTGTAALRQPR
jgi:phosphatidylglycerophosphate synthase